MYLILETFEHELRPTYYIISILGKAKHIKSSIHLERKKHNICLSKHLRRIGSNYRNPPLKKIEVKKCHALSIYERHIHYKEQ